ncbi:MAG: polysaccharide deacetylase family protein [Verrucomicrobia bacterium]|nr:polysaccharide deacetylase family protein [Verrucomicrobiota bacterium]MCG2680854.1 polysaccharide deacetylase family protein [Kiritimatiellia bacterium]MBU4246864.1 polysaccharide deacetylase family protein [Verrucomicrobiota bacterium]MBU4290390.1 polysaccharide deacetylase family protein [Verrucomicrobiota bacterium]MBU4430241.1 polysaccharide deacetylase family protein [Verrucomicrobiota bacterium]
MFHVHAASYGRFPVGAVIVGLILSLGSCRPSAPTPNRSIQPGETVYFVPTAEKMVALTLDDGPNGAATERVLDILKQFRVPATFFLIGTNVTHYPEIVRRMAREGHLIGNHSFQHLRFDQITSRAMLEDIARGEEAITGVTGVKPTWFRPPFGINGVGLDEICRARGVVIAGWSGHAGDWNPQSAVEIAEHMITQATPGDILLLHDGWETRHEVDRHNTVDAVYLILERLTREGFQFVTLPELVRHAGPPLAEFSDGVRLLGLHVQAQPIHPGDAVYIRYFWDIPGGWNYKSAAAFVHFQTGDGFRFQDDHIIRPRGDVRDLAVERTLIIPPNAPVGRYQGRIGLFDPANPDVKLRVPVRSAGLHRKGAVILPDILEIRARSNTNNQVP